MYLRGTNWLLLDIVNKSTRLILFPALFGLRCLFLIMSGSFTSFKTHVQLGDMAVIYLSPRQMYPVRIVEHDIFQTRFGAVRHDDLVGKRYGSRIQCSRGFVHILDMTPDLWTLTLPHRTQILYSTDISLILMQLELRPGSVVIEAGTGSGSLSHSIARTIAPSGRLLTFDFHRERSVAAQKEFEDHGLGEIIVASERDVCADGFGVENGSAHAVFLDLPSPWRAVAHTWRALRNGGRCCCFSPCIEQTQKTAEMLTEAGFEAVETFECINRPWELRNMPLKRFVYKPTTNKEESIEDTIGENDVVVDEEASEAEILNEPKKRKHEGTAEGDDTTSTVNYLASYNPHESVGHTGFLTFATKPYWSCLR